VANTFNFTIKATDSLGANTSKAYQIVINGVVTVSPATLPNSSVGVVYNQSITAAGGTGSKTMTVANYSDGGTGLAAPSTSANTVSFNSTPTTAGTVNFDLKATDTVGAFASQHYTITVAPPCDNPATVTSTLDDGSAGTLRYELTKVCDGGVVNFQAGVTGTITLTTGELLIDKNVTITGPGAAVITVSGNNTSRVFNVQSGKIVSISGLSIANGNATGAFPANEGGGIFNDHGTLTVTSCVFSGNSAGDGGAGLFNSGYLSGTATATIKNCTFSGNNAPGNGGAIYNYGDTGTATL